MSLTSAFVLVRCSRFVLKPALLIFMVIRGSEFEKLLGDYDSLKQEFIGLKSDNVVLKSDNDVLRSEIKSLRDKIGELENRLGLSSRTSSIPPSNDTIANREKIIKSRKERRDEARKKAGTNKKNRVGSKQGLRAIIWLLKMLQMR